MLFLGRREWNVTNQNQIRDEMAQMKDENRADRLQYVQILDRFFT